MTQRTHNHPGIHHRQKGVALVVSLILLVVITLLSVTAMRSANLDTKIAINHQHKQLAFQAAENALTKLTSLDMTDAAMDDLQLPGNIDDAPQTTLLWYQQSGANDTPDLAANLIMDYIEQSAPGKFKFSGFGLNIITHVYQADGTGTVSGTNAQVRNRMHVALLRE
ncbi:PilX N-terminal domain-containing pilus assembly protein [Thiolapillus sp.]